MARSSRSQTPPTCTPTHSLTYTHSTLPHLHHVHLCHVTHVDNCDHTLPCYRYIYACRFCTNYSSWGPVYPACHARTHLHAIASSPPSPAPAFGCASNLFIVTGGTTVHAVHQTFIHGRRFQSKSVPPQQAEVDSYLFRASTVWICF